jgi:hypothetical protein
MLIGSIDGVYNRLYPFIYIGGRLDPFLDVPQQNRLVKMDKHARKRGIITLDLI